MSDAKPALDPENTLHLDLKTGRVVIQLLPDVAPMHVAQIKTLVRRGFYDGTVFHRVIEGFMAQGGDPTGTGTGGSDLDNIRAEFTDKAKFVRGACGMARFHRVIEGFMAQGGDPTGTGTGGSDLDNIRAEFTDKAKFVRGACGMARSQSPHSANSQ